MFSMGELSGMLPELKHERSKSEQLLRVTMHDPRTVGR